MKRFCLALDLQNDPVLIKEYERWHKEVWREIKKSIFDSGITSMDIYRVGNRLFMIIETIDSFSFERKSEMDKSNPKVQEWETLMLNFQKPLEFAANGEKWVLMQNIFHLS